MSMFVLGSLSLVKQYCIYIYTGFPSWRALHGQNSFGLSLSLSENRSSVNIALPAMQLCLQRARKDHWLSKTLDGSWHQQSTEGA